MSGHSKWSTIKRKKGAADAKRGKLFSKLNKEILLAARAGGGDMDTNIRLRNAVATARAANMPKENVQRALKKGTGELEGEQLVEYSYEGYGPGGVAIIVEAISDNRNRTTAEVRHAFAKYGGNLGESGCVGWMFNRKGHFIFPAEGIDMAKFEEVAIENGAEDIKEEDGEIEVTCAVPDFNTLQDAFYKAGYQSETAELAQLPQTLMKLDGKHASTMLKLIDVLEEQDDVQNVWSNFDFDEADLPED